MKKALVALVVLALLVAGFLVFNSYISTEKQGEGASEPGLSKYFEERMVALGVEDIGRPIEGFDSELLMMAYPGLKASDFEGVEALEGHYHAVNGEAVFERNTAQPMSSAERMVTDEGYATLLANLSTRLEQKVQTEADVDALIAKVDTGERVEVKLNESVSALGVKVVPLEVLEDSRCPVDVQCIQAGTVRVKTQIITAMGTSTNTLRLQGDAITTEGEEVRLVNVDPVSESTTEIKDADYLFTFEIKKRELPN